MKPAGLREVDAAEWELSGGIPSEVAQPVVLTHLDTDLCSGCLSWDLKRGTPEHWASLPDSPSQPSRWLFLREADEVPGGQVLPRPDELGMAWVGAAAVSTGLCNLCSRACLPRGRRDSHCCVNTVSKGLCVLTPLSALQAHRVAGLSGGCLVVKRCFPAL